MSATAIDRSASETLGELVNATTAALAEHPTAGVINPAAKTALVPTTATEVTIRAGRHIFTIDEPTSLGGSDLGANPVEHLLASLGACQVITYQIWAAKLGIAVGSIEVDLTGDLDVRGFFGVDAEVRPGFQSIEVSVRVSGPESDERYAELTAAVDEHCPVLDVLTNAVPVSLLHSYNA